jgi:hypothetical protein
MAQVYDRMVVEGAECVAEPVDGLGGIRGT